MPPSGVVINGYCLATVSGSGRFSKSGGYLFQLFQNAYYLPGQKAYCNLLSLKEL
jgi:hypothetical protein